MIYTINNYWKWYFISKIKFNIIKYTKNRESCLISHDRKITLRMLKIHSVQHIDFHLKALNWYKNKWNLYSSLGTYETGIPNQSFNLKERDNSEWRKEHWKEMVAYDFMVDIDATNHNDIEMAKYSTLLVVKLFDKHNIPYEVRFSGMGFHIIVPYSYFKNKNHSFDRQDRDNNIYTFYREIAETLNNEVSEMIDYGLNDARRLCKVPYSLAIYKNNIYVCMPLTLNELESFELENYTPDKIFFKL